MSDADRFVERFEKAWGSPLPFEELVHFDTLPLWARVDPSMMRPGLLDAGRREIGAPAP